MFGLTFVCRFDDLIEEENDVVQEALRRLPAKEQYARAYRIRIAQQCGVTHTELPRDQWVKPQDVLPIPPHTPKTPVSYSPIPCSLRPHVPHPPVVCITSHHPAFFVCGSLLIPGYPILEPHSRPSQSRMGRTHRNGRCHSYQAGL